MNPFFMKKNFIPLYEFQNIYWHSRMKSFFFYFTAALYACELSRASHRSGRHYTRVVCIHKTCTFHHYSRYSLPLLLGSVPPYACCSLKRLVSNCCPWLFVIWEQSLSPTSTGLKLKNPFSTKKPHVSLLRHVVHLTSIHPVWKLFGIVYKYPLWPFRALVLYVFARY